MIGEFKDRFEFPDGNVVIKHKPKEGSARSPSTRSPACSRSRERGTWKTVKGTGAYADVQGNGTYRALGQGFGCDENQPPEVFYFRVVAKGPLSY